MIEPHYIDGTDRELRRIAAEYNRLVTDKFNMEDALVNLNKKILDLDEKRSAIFSYMVEVKKMDEGQRIMAEVERIHEKIISGSRKKKQARA